MKQRFLMLAVAALIASGPAFAQQSQPAQPPAQPAAQTQPNRPRPTISQRRRNQQNRIANGLHNGTMNAGQAAHVENHERRINQQIRADRQANGGKLTGQQRRHINRAQNRASRQIYRDKHNGR